MYQIWALASDEVVLKGPASALESYSAIAIAKNFVSICDIWLTINGGLTELNYK